MNTRLVLGSLLAAQAVLALGLMWQGQVRSMGNEAEPWLDFPSSDVSRIVIADSSNTTKLELQDSKWALVDPALPANSSKINTLLTTLDGLKTTWPVVSTESGRERFEVTEEKHQRELSLFKDDTLLGAYYFGTSPGFRQTHARRAEDDEVYALALNNFDLPADSNDWLDKGLLSAKEPVAIKGPDFALIKNGDTWQFNEDTAAPATTEETATSSEPANASEAAVSSGAGEVDSSSGPPVLSTDAAQKLVDALTNLRVLRVADSTPVGDSVTIEVRTGADNLTYLFTQVDTTYYVRRSDIEHTFTLAEADYKAIAEQNLAGLAASAIATDAGQEPGDGEAQIPPATTSEMQ